MRTEAVRPYYEILKKKQGSLLIKRLFDVVMATVMLAFLLPLFIFIAILVALDSKGGIFFCQERVTQYGRKFRIIKFRTMIAGADNLGTQITVQGDRRITKIGSVLRKYRLDELPQLINVILGDMSFVGTRPESVSYVKKYTPEMFATLLMPAGITSEASIRYKDEAKLLKNGVDVNDIYIKKILPQKMQYNLKSIKKFGCIRDVRIMLRTVIEVVK